jgi:hypothetical protein
MFENGCSKYTRAGEGGRQVAQARAGEIPGRGWSAFSIAAHGVRYDTRRRINAD